MRRGDGNGMGGLDHSIGPGAPVPATVLVVAMNDGSYLLVGHPQGEPASSVIAEDAAPLRQVLATAFGSEQSAGNGVATAGYDPGTGDAAVIGEDRELLAELARLNGDAASFALRIMDGSASVAEQRRYAQRLIAVGERLQHRADGW